MTTKSIVRVNLEIGLTADNFTHSVHFKGVGKEIPVYS